MSWEQKEGLARKTTGCVIIWRQWGYKSGRARCHLPSSIGRFKGGASFSLHPSLRGLSLPVVFCTIGTSPCFAGNRACFFCVYVFSRFFVPGEGAKGGNGMLAILTLLRTQNNNTAVLCRLCHA